jgi:hypothetical protein
MMKLIPILLMTVSMPLPAQWLNYREARTPRKPNGQPDLSAKTPRTAGRPDLSGVWQAERTPLSEYTRAIGKDRVGLQVDLGDVTKLVSDIFWGLKPDQEPLTPEGRAVVARRQKSEAFPPSECLPAGLPEALFVYAFKMVQTRQEIVMLPEDGDPPRQIYMDGRPLPKDPQPAWMGYSVGRWQGDTLVVETTGFNERSWLDGEGHPLSESMRITERYHRRDFGHMDLELTFDDPKYYIRPFTVRTGLNLQPDSDVLEFVCNENEKDRMHSGGR